MTFSELLKQGQSLLAANNIDNPRLDARILLNYAIGVETSNVFDIEVTQLQQDVFLKLIQRRCQREPVSRILGKKGFWKYDFYLSKETLDPRPDTETLIEAVLNEITNKMTSVNIIDLGTGSGCIALSLAGELPNAKVVGVDIASDAVETACQNAQELKIDNCQFLVADWNSSDSLPKKKFDIIVSNPPYIKDDDIKNLEPEVSVFDPLTALSGGKSGVLAYQQIAEVLPLLAEEKVMIFLEIGEGQEQEVIDIMEGQGFAFKHKKYDLAKKIRCLVFYR